MVNLCSLPAFLRLAVLHKGEQVIRSNRSSRHQEEGKVSRTGLVYLLGRRQYRGFSNYREKLLAKFLGVGVPEDQP